MIPALLKQKYASRGWGGGSVDKTLVRFRSPAPTWKLRRSSPGGNPAQGREGLPRKAGWLDQWDR